MTTPGAVAGPAGAPSRAPVGSREGGSKGGAPAKEEGFGDVLSNLEKTDQQSGKAPAAKTGARSGMPRDELDAQSQSTGAVPGAKVAADALSLLEGDLQLVGGAQPDATVTVPAAPATAPADGAAVSMAAIAALSAAGQGSVVAPNAAEPAAADGTPQPDTAAIDGDGASSAPKRSAPPVVAVADAAAASASADAKTAMPTDPNLARLAAAVNGTKDKSTQSTDGGPVDATVTGAPAMAAEVDGNDGLDTRHSRANVVRQEVHFAPVSQTPLVVEGAAAEQAGVSTDGVLLQLDDPGSAGMRPAQQLADRIAAEATSDPAFARHLSGTADQPGGKPPLKILQIQLQPADLGTVTVRMELKDAELVLHVEADRAATAEMIRSDQDSLSKLLRASGYNIESASIRVLEGDRSGASQQNNGQQGGAQANLQSQAQSHSGASQRDGDGQRGNSQTSSGDATQARRNDTHGTTAQRTGSGLYI